MLSKKRNDLFYWKNKLETLNGLPGEAAPEKDALWEKLNGRLQQKPAAQKARWYWIAAGLLPLIIIALLVVRNAENILLKQETVTNKNIKTAPSYILPASTEVVTLSLSIPVEKKQHVDSVNSKVKNKTLNDTIKEVDVVVTLLPEKDKSDIATNNILPVDTVVTVAATTAVKKKLPVVHINELEAYSAEFTEPVNYTRDIKFRKNKINNQNVTAQQNSIGFKIKLSSKN